MFTSGVATSSVCVAAGGCEVTRPCPVVSLGWPTPALFWRSINCSNLATWSCNALNDDALSAGTELVALWVTGITLSDSDDMFSFTSCNQWNLFKPFGGRMLKSESFFGLSLSHVLFTVELDSLSNRWIFSCVPFRGLTCWYYDFTITALVDILYWCHV